MWWFLTCTLLAVVGCGETGQSQGVTVVNIMPVPATGDLEWDVSCGDEPGQLGELDEVIFPPDPCEFLLDAPEVCQAFMDLPPGQTCTMVIRLSDLETGDTCVQEEAFMVAEAGDNEVNVTLDNCTPVATIPF